MNVLLDTCALLGLAGGDLPHGAAVALRKAPEADPFDRVIVPLAQTHGLTVLTSDENIQKYAGVKSLW